MTYPNGYYSKKTFEEKDITELFFAGYAVTLEEANEFSIGAVFTAAVNGQWYVKVKENDYRFWTLTYSDD